MTPVPPPRRVVLDPDLVAAVLGPRDEHLDAVSAVADVDVLARGNEVTLDGAPGEVSVAARLLDEMQRLVAAGAALDVDVVRRLAGMLRGQEDRPRGAGPGDPADAAPRTRPSDVLTSGVLSSRGRTVRPKTLGQKRYVDTIGQNTVTFGVGPAGTGKTYLAMALAVRALQEKRVSRLVLTRPAVEAGERLGFLPGTLEEKIDPYLRPLHDALGDMLDREAVPRLTETGVLEVAPLAYMRGRTLNDSFVVLDEAQNTTEEQMRMFLTRLGFGTTVVVTGDVTQTDLPRGRRSGLATALEVLADVDDIGVVHLDSSDVVRHRLVGDVVDAWERHDARKARDEA